MALKPSARPEQREPDKQGALFDLSPSETPSKVPPFKAIYVHFESQEDMDALARVIGQKIDKTVTEIWFPALTIDELKK